MIIKAWLNGEVKIYQRKAAWVRCNVTGNKVYSISMPRSFKIKREFFPYLTIAPNNNVKEKKGDSYGVSRDKGRVDGARTSSKTIKMCFVNTKIEKGRVHEKMYYCEPGQKKR
jgi:hypothetical protein